VRTAAERGFTLIESVVGVAVAGIAVGALAYAVGGFGRFATHQTGPVRAAASALAEQTLRTAEDAWKYGSPGTSPSGSIETTLPLVPPGGVPTGVPVTVTTAVSGASPTSADLTVTVRYPPDADHTEDRGTLTLRGAVHVKAPLPASTVAPASLVPQPAGS
jgi:prepilin-type N-terminal cleavage/methylation domain-containing protein